MGKFIFNNGVPKERTIVKETFLKKSVPVLFIGLFIWMISTISFGGTILLFTLTLPFYIFSVILYVILWITLIILAIMRKNRVSMILFFITAFITGIVQSPIITWAGLVLGSMELAILLFLYASVFGTIASGFALLLGYIYRDRLEHWSGLWLILLIYGFIVLFIEIILGFFYSWDQYILITSGLVLVWIFGTIIYDGSKLDKYSDDEWMMITLGIFLDLIIVIVRLFIYLVSAFAKNKDD